MTESNQIVKPSDADETDIQQDEWAQLSESEDVSDPLLSCLVFLSHYFKRPSSGEVLKAGLPAYQGMMSPELFIRAAGFAGFKSRVVEKKLNALSDLVLPVVVPLKNQQAGVLIKKLDAENVEMMLPESGGGIQSVALADLEILYSGYIILIRPEYRESHETDDPYKSKQLHWFWQLLYRDWWIYIQVAMAALLINIFALSIPLFIMTVYDRVIPNNSQDTLWVLAIGAVTVFVFDLIVKTLRGYFVDVSGKRVDVLLAQRVFDQVLNISLKAKPSTSGIFANTLKEMESLRDFFTSATILSLVDLPFVFFFIAVFWLIGGSLAWILMIVVPTVFIIILVFQIPLNKAVREAYKHGEQKHAVLIESLVGLETIKAIGADARAREQWQRNVAQNALAGQKSRFWSLSSINVMMFATQFTTVSIVVFGVYLVHSGDLTFGMLVACVMLSGRTLAPLTQVAQMLVRLHHAKSAYRSLNRLMNMPVERSVEKQFIHRPKLMGNIFFKEVSFSYPKQKYYALNELNLKIKSGERVGIIGRIGSGKTTLQKMILALYEPTEGSILIDGIDIRQIDPIDLRQAIGYVPQDLFLFQGTVKDNIVAAYPRATDEQIIDAAKLAGVDDFVSVHPMGYDMPVGERGEALSGGQRQTVALARALLTNPSILLFDEPTNSMDNRSEELFRSRIEPLLEGRTLVLVTHRTSLLSMVNRLVVMDKSRIIADGPRQAVIDAIASGQVMVNED